MNLRALCRLLNCLDELFPTFRIIQQLLDVWVMDTSIAYVVHDGVIEQDAVLGYDGDLRP